MVAWCDSLQAVAAPRVMKPTWEILTLLAQRRIATPLIYRPLAILQRFWEVQAPDFASQHVVLALEPALPGTGPYAMLRLIGCRAVGEANPSSSPSDMV